MKLSKQFLISKNLIIVLLALFIATFISRYLLANSQIIASDGILYIEVAKDILTGNFQGVSEHGNYGFFTLYPFLIALFQIFFHNWELSGKMVSIVFGSLTMIPLFFLIRGLFNQIMAIVSTLFYVVHPRFAEYSSDVLREPVFWFFSITALWLAREGILRKKYILFILSSMSTALAIFTKTEGVLVIFVIIMWLLWFLLNDKENRKRGLLYICIFLFSLPALASPGLILLKNKLNRWEPGHSITRITDIMNSSTLPSELVKELPENASYKLQAFFDVSTRHWYAIYFMEVLYKFFKSFNIILFLLFLCGIYKRRFIPYSQNDIMTFIWFSAAFIGSFLYLTKTYYFGTRHGLLMVFPALAWAGVGFFEIQERIRKWFGDTKIFHKYARFDTLLLIILILIVLVPQTVFSLRNDKVELKKAGIVLKNMGYSNTTLIVQPTLSRVAFYADAELIWLPNKIDSNAMKVLITQNNATLLIIDERTIDQFAPGIRKIIEQSMFEKLTTPEMAQYRKYLFSIYKIR